MSSSFKIVWHHISTLLFALFVTTMGIVSIVHYDYENLSWIGIIGYISIIAFVVSVMLLCCRKWYMIRPYIAVAIILLLLVAVWFFYTQSRFTTGDLTDYLQDNTTFNEIASMFLPTDQEVMESKHVNYRHIKWLAEREYISLSVQYDQEDFAKIKARLSDAHATAIHTHAEPPYYWRSGHLFYRSGLLYQTYDLMYEHSYYTVAVSLCEETMGMSFIILSDPDLASIAVDDILDVLDIT